ncbi:MAG: TonB-dependent receptor, partial [Nevskiales bacterium]
MPYRKKALIAGIAACFTVSAGAVSTAAYAQDTAPAAATPADDSTSSTSKAEQLQGVTVTGIRASLKKSLDRKRDNDSITEVITAEDIGKLPATNTAEALAQVPGITLDHALGAQQRVSIDGLDPSLNLSFLDGHPVAQAIWLYGDSPNRGFNFSLLPPEILGAIEVYKTPEARLIEGSIGGTILMHTLQPLDLPANTMTGSVGYDYNDMAENGKPNAAVFYSWKDPSKRIGFNVAVQHFEQITNREGLEIFGYSPLSAIAPNSPYVTSQIASGALRPTDLLPQEINAAYFQQTEKRDSVNTNIQFRPTKNIDVGVGAMWMQDRLDNLNQSMYAFTAWTPSTQAGIDSLTPGNNGVIIGGHNCDPSTAPSTTPCSGIGGTILDANARRSLITTQGLDLHGTYKGEGWKLYGQVGISNSHDVLQQAFIEPVYTGGYTWSIGQGFAFDDPNAAQNPANWKENGGFFGNYASEPYSARDNYGQVDFSKDFDGFINQLLIGFRYAVHHEGQTLNVYTGVSTTTAAGNPVSLADVGAGPLTDLSGLSSLNFLPGSINHVQPGSGDAVYNWVLGTPNLVSQANLYYPFYYQNTFLVSQATEAAYAQLNFGRDKLRGNVGVRVVRTDTSSSGYQLTGGADPTVPGAGVYTTEDTIHVDPLPSLNLSYDLTPHTVLRGAVSEVIAYAPYNQMAPYVVTNDTVLTGAGGNAHLDPYKSINLNLAAEWYFAPESLLSATYFHKQIINYIEQGAGTERLFDSLFKTSPIQYGQLPTSADCDGNGFCNFGITRPENGGRAAVDGFAVSFQEPFSDTGFGIRGNLTYADGRTKTGGALPYT